MNKRILTTVVMLALAVGVVTPALAKNDKPDTRQFGQEIKDERQSFRDSIASRSQQFKQTVKNKLAEARKNRVGGEIVCEVW